MTTALLVIDVQDSFLRRESWAASSAPDIAQRCARLVEAARAQGHEVVWVLHAEPGSQGPFDPAHGYVRLMAGLEPRAGEPVVTKTSHNAFTTTNLQQILTQRGVTRLTICGIRTEQCCETTARLGSDLGYAVTFVIDATATTPIETPGAPAGRPLSEVLADPATLTTDEILRRTEYALAGRFADVVRLDDVAPLPALAH